MEQYFNCIADMKGYEGFEKEAWGFKVRLYFCSLARLIPNSTTALTSSVGYLMQTVRVKFEPAISPGSWSSSRLFSTPPAFFVLSDGVLFQSSLLKYTEFSPRERSECTPSPEPRVPSNPVSNQNRTRPSRWWSLRSSSRDRITQRQSSQSEARPAHEKRQTRPIKRVPVFFLDEAHKLYAFQSSCSSTLK